MRLKIAVVEKPNTKVILSLHTGIFFNSVYSLFQPFLRTAETTAGINQYLQIMTPGIGVKNYTRRLLGLVWFTISALIRVEEDHQRWSGVG